MFRTKKLFNKHWKLLVVLTLITLGVLYYYKNTLIKFWGNDTSRINNPKVTNAFGCSRTTRLDNIPVYDRALSLIQEKYGIWEKGGKDNYGTYYFFPSQLVNCIKVVEGNVKDTTSAEGYFIFNDSDIKEDYFPITVDKSYSEADDIVNSLLLVHEITHVRQYLDSLNKGDKLSCIDKEVEAFDASYNFYRWQYGETEKSLDLRLKYDENLNPQLQIIKNIGDSQKIIMPLTELCKGEIATDTCGDRIMANRRQKIKDIVSKDAYYIKQCGL